MIIDFLKSLAKVLCKGLFRLPYKTVRCHTSDKISEHIFQLLKKINEINCMPQNTAILFTDISLTYLI